MTVESTTLTLLIAAHEPGQAAALSEILHALRSDVRIRFMGDDGPIDMAMVVGLPGEQLGEQLEQVRERFADAVLVLIAPVFDEQAIALAARHEVAAILPSPCEPLALTRMLRAQERKVRFAGRCGSVETAELLRLHAIAASNGIVHLHGEGRSGAIHLEDGQPVHAYCGEIEGTEAVRELLRWLDVDVTWIDGRSGGARTIAGRIEGLLERELGDATGEVELQEATPEMLERIEYLAGIEDILGVYLLRNGDVLFGRNDPSLDEALTGRALSGLARVFHDMEDQQGAQVGTEIQAMVGEHRLVVDRVGPARLGFQIGVVVRQATPVCKSLRRLLRQVDRMFRRTLKERARQDAAATASAVDLHRAVG